MNRRHEKLRKRARMLIHMCEARRVNARLLLSMCPDLMGLVERVRLLLGASCEDEPVNQKHDLAEKEAAQADDLILGNHHRMLDAA